MSGSITKFPFFITTLKEPDLSAVKAKFKGFIGGVVDVEGCHFMPSHYALFAQKYYDFEFSKDDVLIATFPRSGTTWTQEIVWSMRNGLDFETAKKVCLDERSPFLELDSILGPHLPHPEHLVKSFEARHPGKDPKVEGLILDLAKTAPSPRTIKTHLPFSLINPNVLDTCKVVYVARNPKDVCVSAYHQQRLMKVIEFTGDFAEYVDFWCRDLTLRAPYWSHLSEAWAKKDHPNMHFMFYEDLKEDIAREIQKLNVFLGTGLTGNQLKQVAEYTDFSKMKSNYAPHEAAALKKGFRIKGEADFLRTGTTGGWKDYFTPELDKKFETWLVNGGDIVHQMPLKYTL